MVEPVPVGCKPALVCTLHWLPSFPCNACSVRPQLQFGASAAGAALPAQLFLHEHLLPLSPTQPCTNTAVGTEVGKQHMICLNQGMEWRGEFDGGNGNSKANSKKKVGVFIVHQLMEMNWSPGSMVQAYSWLLCVLW